MKYSLKYILSCIITVMMVATVLISCNDDLPNNGQPMISYIRVTDPAKSDSLLVSGLLGNLITIVGENLGGAREIWFNDQQASFNPNLITNKTILVNIPTNAPAVVTDKLRLVFANGGELSYDFVISIPPPVLSSMKLEWVPDGETAVINGDYFFEPLQVTLSDGTVAEVTSVTAKQVQFKVPADAAAGPLTVKTNFGKTNSTFWFRDNRNVFLNYDNLTASGSWRPGTIGTTGGIDGNYMLLRGVLDKNARTEDYANGGFVSQYWGHSNRPESNLFDGDPNDYCIKFEAKVVSWYGSYLNICFAPWSNAGNQEYWSNLNARGLWHPWEDANAEYKTDGWITVTIPLSDFTHKIANDVNGDVIYPEMSFDKTVTGSLTFWMVGTPKANQSPVEVYFDNVRIVPK